MQSRRPKDFCQASDKVFKDIFNSKLNWKELNKFQIVAVDSSFQHLQTISLHASEEKERCSKRSVLYQKVSLHWRQNLGRGMSDKIALLLFFF